MNSWLPVCRTLVVTSVLIPFLFACLSGARAEDPLEGLIHEADSALGTRGERSGSGDLKRGGKSGSKKSSGQQTPAGMAPAGQSGTAPAPAATPAVPKDDPVEVKRREELSRVFLIESQKREERPASPRFGIDFGLNLAAEIHGGSGLRSVYFHDEDTFAVERSDPLWGAEFFAQKDLLGLFGDPANEEGTANRFGLLVRASFGMLQGDVEVEQSGVQERVIVVTHRVVQGALSLVGDVQPIKSLHVGIGLGYGFASLNQLGLGVTDTFLVSYSLPVFDVQVGYDVHPDWRIVLGLRRLGLSSVAEDATSALGATVGVVTGF